MPNPVVVTCPEGVWTLIAGNVSEGQIIKKNFDPSYQITYRVAGDPAPTTLADGKVMQNDSLPIFARATETIDVYAYPTGGDGLLEIDI